MAAAATSSQSTTTTNPNQRLAAANNNINVIDATTEMNQLEYQHNKSSIGGALHYGNAAQMANVNGIGTLQQCQLGQPPPVAAPTTIADSDGVYRVPGESGFVGGTRYVIGGAMNHKPWNYRIGLNGTESNHRPVNMNAANFYAQQQHYRQHSQY